MAGNAVIWPPGSNYIPWLDQGSDAIKHQGDELARLGHVMSGSELKSNAAFEDSLIKLKTSISGLAQVVATTLIPQCCQLSIQ